MNPVSFPMYKSQFFIIGMISLIFSLDKEKEFVFNSVDKNDSLSPVLNTYKDTYVVPIALFFTGILIHVLLEYIGLNKWYCEKKCIKDRCKIVCEREI